MADQKTPPKVFKAYPAKRYHATQAPVYVQTEAEDRELGPGWGDHPSKAKPPKPPKPPKQEA